MLGNTLSHLQDLYRIAGGRLGWFVMQGRTRRHHAGAGDSSGGKRSLELGLRATTFPKVSGSTTPPRRRSAWDPQSDSTSTGLCVQGTSRPPTIPPTKG